MEAKTIKTLELDNGHTLEIFDRSRKISKDAWLVTMTAQVTVPIRADLFSNSHGKTSNNVPPVDQLIQTLGDTVTFTHHRERNFIMDPDRDAVFNQLVDTFLSTVLPYVSKPSFPEKFILKCYKDKS